MSRASNAAETAVLRRNRRAYRLRHVLGPRCNYCEHGAQPLRGSCVRVTARATSMVGTELAPALLLLLASEFRMELPQDGRRRAFIEQVRPGVDCGRAALKRVLGETVEVQADVIAEGHERIACVLLHAPAGSENWTAVRMVEREEDVWQASFAPAQLGRHRYTVAA